MSELNKQIIYSRRNKKFKMVKKRAALDEYVFYSILNTDIPMELGVAASMITRGILGLYNKLATDRAKNPYVVQWQNSGEHIIVLQGYDHRHLKYLENEAKFAALGTHAIYHRWYHNRIMLVLSVFGRKEEIEDVFDGLSYLR
ncbi:PREDICTED: uncharacterized protein LOC108765928 [Trachymyrmex cornetzi]|uniref:uncharacterized protein LOC108765928 n=1 Tax=Trachymyrmex cornetzi TaxID=471704 RepID=UPI00084F5D90|nr:PREDICTED: uncharacterized protein LOC108765928 [Trachymyrmex cornetzi]